MINNNLFLRLLIIFIFFISSNCNNFESTKCSQEQRKKQFICLTLCDALEGQQQILCGGDPTCEMNVYDGWVMCFTSCPCSAGF